MPPVDRRGLILWIVAYAAMTILVIAIGLLVVHELGGVRSLDNRVALSPIENLSNRFPLGRHSLEGQHPDEPGVAVTKPEVLAGQLEDRHSDG